MLRIAPVLGVSGGVTTTGGVTGGGGTFGLSFLGKALEINKERENKANENKKTATTIFFGVKGLFIIFSSVIVPCPKAV